MKGYLTRTIRLVQENPLFYIERYFIPLVMISQVFIYFMGRESKSYELGSIFGNVLKPIIFATFLVLSSSKKKKLDLRAALGLVMSFSILHFLEMAHEKINLDVKAVMAFCYFFYVCMFLIALGNLGKSFTIIPTFTKIKSNGLYTVIRHPLYSSYIHFAIVFIIINHTCKNFGLFVIMVIGLILRSISEERFLNSQDVRYEEVMKLKPRYFHFYVSLPVLLLILAIFYF